MQQHSSTQTTNVMISFSTSSHTSKGYHIDSQLRDYAHSKPPGNIAREIGYAGKATTMTVPLLTSIEWCLWHPRFCPK